MTDFKYRAFISYSWSDRAWGEWLHHALETYRAPKGVGDGRSLHPIFKDREEEAAGASIGQSIEAAMLASEFLIVLCSPRSAQSKWVNREVAWFKTHRDPRKILTLIVDGEPGASLMEGRESEECFPKTLLFKVMPDLQPADEMEDHPLAADARDSGDGKRGAKLKLAAAMLGLGLDDLVKRDDRRRTKRRRLVMAGMAAGMAVLSGVTVYAVVQRNSAVTARNDAVAAQAKAEAAEKDAKFQADEAQSLVEFMLTDFRQELDSLGRLDVLERTGKRLLDSFAKQDVAKLDANALGRRARVLLLLGEVDNTRGHLDAALARYKEAAATTEELLKRNPESAQQIFDHAQSVYWVGYIAWQRGDAVLAKKQFTRYYDLAQQLVAIDPDKDEWRIEVGYAVNNLGILAMDQGEAAEAEKAFRQYLEVTTLLSEKDPDDVGRVIEVGQAYAWLADSIYTQARIEDARTTRLAEAALYENALVDFPNHAGVMDSALVAQLSLAIISIAGNELAAAVTYSNRAVHLADALRSQEPDSVFPVLRASVTRTFLGETYFHLRKTDQAREFLSTAIQIGKTLVAKDAGVSEWRSTTLPDALLALGRLESRDGNSGKAREIDDEIIADLRPLVTDGSPSARITRRYCAALAGRARLSPRNASAWVEILGLLGPMQLKQGPEALSLLAEAYQHTDKPAEAAAIVEHLYAAGYRHPDFMALLEEFPALKAAAEAGPAAAE